MSDNKIFYLIEKPQPGGTYWFKGYKNLFMSLPDCYAEYFTESVDDAIQFHSADDAEAVRRMFPKSWPYVFEITEHCWMGD